MHTTYWGWGLALVVAFTGCTNETADGSPTSGTSSDSGEDEAAPQAGSSGGLATTSATPTNDAADSGMAGSSGGLSDDVETVELRIERFQVPTAETFYACFEWTMTTDQLHHIVGFGPSIDNAPYVHHFVATLLDEPTGIEPGTPCFDITGDTIYAWAPGVAPFMLPPEAGVLVGDKPGGSFTLRLQIHYNNPLGDAGQVDASGIDVMLTPSLREHDAQVLVVADVAGISIPPKSADYEHVATCSSSATMANLTHPIEVFASSLHAHEIGKTLWTEVWRDGEFIEELNRAEPFVFDNQQLTTVRTTIAPGDTIVNHCIYDSSDRSGVTHGGPASADEMCWNTLMYYPRLENGFDYCTSGS